MPNFMSRCESAVRLKEGSHRSLFESSREFPTELADVRGIFTRFDKCQRTESTDFQLCVDVNQMAARRESRIGRWFRGSMG